MAALTQALPDAPPPSAAWYRVAGLRPRLRATVRVHRHEYRSERWYVIEDRVSRRTHRFDYAACFLIACMDGRRSLQQIWEAAAQRLGEQAPGQEQVIALLGQLHAADLLLTEVTPDVDELLRRVRRVARRDLLARVISPLAIKVPLLDPDRLLERWLPWYRPLFGPLGAALWLAAVGWAMLAAAQHWDALTLDITDRVLAPENLIIMGLVFPLLKAMHEFGHACAVKSWGGEVHEMGIMFLVLFPVPYVDATSANTFPQKHRRLVVGAAGMAVELLVASLALYLWLDMQPGVPRAILFSAMLIAGVSTVLFNANPLLRFDGYYILADLIELPNLRQRSQQFLATAFQRAVFGLELPAVEATGRERAWFVFYAVASWIYRLVIVLGIALFIATEYFLLGVLLALWAVLSALVWPLVALAGYLAFSPRLRRHRPRAIATSAVLAGALAAVVFLVPVPYWTNAQGVVWLPEQLAVRAGADGFVTRVVAQSGAEVQRGDVLLETDDPALPARISGLEAQRRELETRYLADSVDRLVRAQMTLEQLKAVDADLARARERARELVVRSPASGVFAVSAAQDLPGRFLKHGEQIGHVIPGDSPRARVLVPQRSVDLVRSRTEQVRVKLAERLADTLPANILREVPQASDRLPSLALAQAGGGELALDPQSGAQPRTMQTHFEFEIEMPTARGAGLGGRVHVRFEHGRETLAGQAWRWLRQLFLRRFSI